MTEDLGLPTTTSSSLMTKDLGLPSTTSPNQMTEDLGLPSTTSSGQMTEDLGLLSLMSRRNKADTESHTASSTYPLLAFSIQPRSTPVDTFCLPVPVLPNRCTRLLFLSICHPVAYGTACRRFLSQPPPWASFKEGIQRQASTNCIVQLFLTFYLI